jgi:hypothetical protein
MLPQTLKGKEEQSRSARLAHRITAIFNTVAREIEKYPYRATRRLHRHLTSQRIKDLG